MLGEGSSTAPSETYPAESGKIGPAGNGQNIAGATNSGQSRLSRALRIEWLGQTVASLCWIVSVFTYGLNSVGDWLQLCAASAWLIANVAALMTTEND